MRFWLFICSTLVKTSRYGRCLCRDVHENVILLHDDDRLSLILIEFVHENSLYLHLYVHLSMQIYSLIVSDEHENRLLLLLVYVIFVFYKKRKERNFIPLQRQSNALLLSCFRYFFQRWFDKLSFDIINFNC